MNLKSQNRNHRLSLFLVRKKIDKGKPKDQTLVNFGTYPDTTLLASSEGIKLSKKIVQAVQEEEKMELLHDKMPPDELAEFLNYQLDLSSSKVINFAPLLIRTALKDFKLEKCFERFQKHSRCGYNFYDYFNFIIARNIIRPASLLNYFKEQDEFLFQLSWGPIKEQDLYEFLSFFYEHRKEIHENYFKGAIEIIGADKSRENLEIDYDGTNFTYSVSKPDKEFKDPIEGIKPGLRQFGPSKNKRFDRVCVGLSLMTTAKEIPLEDLVFPGNEQEISHFKEEIDLVLRSLFDLNIPSRGIFMADAGNYSGDIVFRLAGPNNIPDSGDGYIIGRGIGQVDEDTRSWALSPEGYYPISKRKDHHNKKQRKNSYCTMVKSRIVYVDNYYQTQEGKKKKTKVLQKQVALFSPKRRYKALETLERKIKKVLAAADRPGELRKIFNKSYLKFADIYGLIKETGELSDYLKAWINEEEIKAEINRAGVFIIATSETGWPDGKILHCYKEKYKVEHLFRTLKSVIKASPAYVFKYEHIVSHFHLCVISVAVLEYIREKTFSFTHVAMSPERIQKVLQKMQALAFGNGILIIPPLDEDAKLILSAFDIDLNKSIMTEKALKRNFELYG